MVTWLLVLAASLWAMQRLDLGLAATIAIHLFLGFIILLPLDRWLDDRLRRTVLLGGG